MHWSGWDVAVVLATVLQIATLVALGMNVARLGRSTRRLAQRVPRLAQKGAALVGAVLSFWQKNQVRVVQVVGQVRLTGVHLARLTDRTHTAHLPINWWRIFAAYTTARTVRGYVHYAQTLLARVQKRPAPIAKAAKAKRPEKAPFFERIGLMPPLVTRLQRYTPYVRTALEVRKELKRRGVL